jgi:hypothetical protein
MDAALFIVFLSQLIRGLTRKVYLVADRLQAHQAGVVQQQWLAEHKDRIEMVALPKHSPEMNASEYLNNDRKGNVKAEGLPDNKGDLRSLIQAFLRKLLSPDASD